MMPRPTCRPKVTLLPVVVALWSAVVLAALWAAPVAAECTWSDPWPSFTMAAPAASRVFVGTVESVGPPDSADYSAEFTVRVNETLRGPSADRLSFVKLRSGLPLRRCDQTDLRVKQGDVIAFALDARRPAWQNLRASTYAYIEGTPDSFFSTGVERLSLDAVRRLASLPPTDADAEADLSPGVLMSERIVFLVVVASAAAVFARRRFGRPVFG